MRKSVLVQVKQVDFIKFVENSFNVIREYRTTFSLYIPDKDKFNNIIDGTFWVKKIANEFASIFGGCNVNYCEGFWNQFGTIINEKTAVVSFFFKEEVFESKLEIIRQILDDFYYSTNQDTLLFCIENDVYYYRPFPKKCSESEFKK